MYEHHKEPLLPPAAFVRRLLVHAGVAGTIILGSLAVGVIGYHALEGLGWLDALLNAAMLLGGMGPVNALHTQAGKLFAACYALYSGIVFLVVAGILFTPLFHRFLHKFHLELAEDEEAREETWERHGSAPGPRAAVERPGQGRPANQGLRAPTQPEP